MEVLALILLLIGVAGAVARPWGIPAWLTPTAAAVVVVLVEISSLSQVGHDLRPLAGAVGFLVAAVPLAVMLDRLGFFESLASRFVGGSRMTGWLWALAAAVTTVLNLDASVVLLTPLYIRIARRRGINPKVLAVQPVILALLASSALPVSNLTNLIASGRTGAGPGPFLDHLALPSLAATVVGYGLYRWAVAKGLLGPSRPVTPTGHAIALDGPTSLAPARAERARRHALAIGGVIVVLVLAGFVAGPSVGLAPWQVAVAADIVLVALLGSIPGRAVPWGTALVAASLAVLAGAVGRQLGLNHLLAGRGVGSTAILAGGAAVAANVVNNLPALLVGLTGSSHHVTPGLWALLLGVNMGPSILVTGSLASLLWLESTRQMGVAFTPRDYARIGWRVGLPASVIALAVLLAIGPGGL
ncbi:MAG: SLC13 family permease [Acidimicrobiales bacterium]